MKNRKKVGTGKLRTFWEDMVYVVVDKDEHNPVYSIKPVKGRAKLKRVHRNDIMQCNELLDKDLAASDEKSPMSSCTSKPSIKSKTAAVKKASEVVPENVVSDDDSDSELLGIVREDGAAEVFEDVEVAENADTEEDDLAEMVPEIAEEDEEVAETESINENESEVEENPEDPPSPDESDESSSPSPSTPRRTSARARTQTKRLTYHVAGGDPKYS